MSDEALAVRVVAAARAWIGTPYRHRASVLGAGADCLGLVRGVWRTLFGDEPEAVPAYAALWAEDGGVESLRDALARHLTEIAVEAAVAGDVLLFRFTPRTPAKHAAVLSAPDRMIHAYSGHAVAETALGPWWWRRRAYAFRFPTRVIPAAVRSAESRDPGAGSAGAQSPGSRVSDACGGLARDDI